MATAMGSGWGMVKATGWLHRPEAAEEGEVAVGRRYR
jgi:hypothetical protein